MCAIILLSSYLVIRNILRISLKTHRRHWSRRKIKLNKSIDWGSNMNNILQKFQRNWIEKIRYCCTTDTVHIHVHVSLYRGGGGWGALGFPWPPPQSSMLIYSVHVTCIIYAAYVHTQYQYSQVWGFKYMYVHVYMYSHVVVTCEFYESLACMNEYLSHFLN